MKIISSTFTMLVATIASSTAHAGENVPYWSKSSKSSMSMRSQKSGKGKGKGGSSHHHYPPCIVDTTFGSSPASNFTDLTELTLGNKCFEIFVNEAKVCRQLLGYPVLVNNVNLDLQVGYCCPESFLDIDELNLVCTKVNVGPIEGCFDNSTVLPSGIGAAVLLQVGDQEFSKEPAMTGDIETLCCDSGSDEGDLL